MKNFLGFLVCFVLLACLPIKSFAEYAPEKSKRVNEYVAAPHVYIIKIYPVWDEIIKDEMRTIGGKIVKLYFYYADVPNGIRTYIFEENIDIDENIPKEIKKYYEKYIKPSIEKDGG